MAVPSVITDLNVSAASNSPAGTDPIGNTLDDFLRSFQAMLRREQAQGASIASASTTNIASNTDGNYVHITGTTTITSFGTVAAGISRTVVFDGVLTLTHNASSLVLPGGANITTAAGDIAEFVSEGSGNWRCVKYIPVAQYYLSKSVAGGTDVTLTSAEAGAWVITLTGVLTANINVIFPTTLKQWLVVNNTTGSFTVTCKTASGTGATVTQGSTQSFYGDGTNLVAGFNSSAPSLQGAFKNLSISTTGTNATVSASVDEIVLKSSANAYITRRVVSISINTAATGKNGLSTGTLAASTWYAVFAGYDGTSDCGWIDPSATSPTVPSGVTHWARIGWIRTDGTGNKYPLRFEQYDRRAQYMPAPGTNVTSLPIMASGAAGNVNTPTYAAVGVSAFVPPTARSITGNIGTGSLAIFAANNNASVAGVTNPPILSLATPASSYQIMAFDVLLESTNLYWANNGTAHMACIGWGDSL